MVPGLRMLNNSYKAKTRRTNTVLTYHSNKRKFIVLCVFCNHLLLFLLIAVILISNVH